jgi:hypothetical protein
MVKSNLEEVFDFEKNKHVIFLLCEKLFEVDCIEERKGEMAVSVS